jgi:hypothetical protein
MEPHRSGPAGSTSGNPIRFQSSIHWSAHHFNGIVEMRETLKVHETFRFIRLKSAINRHLLLRPLPGLPLLSRLSRGDTPAKAGGLLAILAAPPSRSVERCDRVASDSTGGNLGH